MLLGDVGDRETEDIMSSMLEVGFILCLSVGSGKL
jgi:hypothetical protein